jgi:hypothetical protein
VKLALILILVFPSLPAGSGPCAGGMQTNYAWQLVMIGGLIPSIQKVVTGWSGC